MTARLLAVIIYFCVCFSAGFSVSTLFGLPTRYGAVFGFSIMIVISGIELVKQSNKSSCGKQAELTQFGGER